MVESIYACNALRTLTHSVSYFLLLQEEILEIITVGFSSETLKSHIDIVVVDFAFITLEEKNKIFKFLL